MADPQTVIEGTLKYRDSKKWKPRWCVIRKLSPVADCLHLQLYRDSKDRCKNGPTKASLSLEGFLGMETGFTLDKESNTMALICSEVVVVLAFDSRELLIQWQVKVRASLVEEHQFLVQIAHVPARSKLASGPARLHLLDYMFCLTAGVPPKLLGIWPLKELRRFGVVDGKFCFEGGSRCGKGEGLHVLLTNQAKDLVQTFDMASRGQLPGKRKVSVRKNTAGSESNTRGSLHSRLQGCCNAGNDVSNKNILTCSTESPAKTLCSNSDMTETGKHKHDKSSSVGTESHIRPCHVHYRWPSCVVPCGTGNTSEEPQRKTIARTTSGTQGQMMWALPHCPGCAIRYCRTNTNEKERVLTSTENVQRNEPTGFTPQWTMDINVMSPTKDGMLVNTRSGNQNCPKPPHDRSSLCSQSSHSSGTSNGSNASTSSSSSSISEYSVPKNLEGFYDRPKNVHHIHPNPAFNRLSFTEDNTQNKLDATTPCCGLRGNLGPIRETGGLPPCTCFKRKAEKQLQDFLLLTNEFTCTCCDRNKRHSMDVDMPSFSSSGSSNASPSTSPKKQPPFMGVPILLPCTCGKISNNPYLNYDVPRSCAPVKEVNNANTSANSLSRNITEAESTAAPQETKIINKMDNSTCDNKEDNGNKVLKDIQNKVSDTGLKTPTFPQQFCPCQRLLFCPTNFMPRCPKLPTSVKDDGLQPQTNRLNAEYATVSKKPDSSFPQDGNIKCNIPENENQRRGQNLNLYCPQRPMVFPVPMDCWRGKMAAFGVPIVNTWKKDNANHIYVNLKYLQETVAKLSQNQATSQKLIPYYANLYFLQTLSLYENAGMLTENHPNLFSHDQEGTSHDPSEGGTTNEGKTVINKKKLEIPTSNNGVYEMMSFNRDESPSGSSDNYMLMQPGVNIGTEDEASAEKVMSASAPATSFAAPESEECTEDGSHCPADSDKFDAMSLPLRPFMPILLPFHEHSCETKEAAESQADGRQSDKKCSADGNCRSSRSNSLGDLQLNALRRGRSSSTEGRQCSGDKVRDEGNTSNASCSPKTTPIRKHPLLTKLTFKSKEKSFSTDEITPPSTAPSSPDSMFLESIQKYPFHRSADCLQLDEEYRLSEEDLSQDPEVIMSQSIEKGRSTLSIKRSSSVPCKANPPKHHSGNSSETHGSSRVPEGAAVFSHFIAYHGSLPRRCSGNSSSRHPLVDRKPPAPPPTCAKEPQKNCAEQRIPSDSANMIFISECKQCHQFVTSPEGLLVLDAKSMTSSSSSDMSDYIESLSLCSRSSSGSSGVGCGSGEYVRSEELHKITTCTSSLRPRSGKEYHSFDRVVFQENYPCIPANECSHLTLPCLKPFVDDMCQANDLIYTNSSSDPKYNKNTAGSKTNSPSPGYVSSSPSNPDFISPEKTGQHFVFPKENKDLNYLEVVSVSESEPTSPVVKSSSVQYAVIDMVATAAAKKLGAERAQLRDAECSSPKSSPKHT